MISKERLVQYWCKHANQQKKKNELKRLQLMQYKLMKTHEKVEKEK